MEFETGQGTVQAINQVSFQLKEGECLGLAGESGSGKSVTAMLLMGLLPASSARIRSGEVIYTNEKGKSINLLQLNTKDIRSIRGKDIAIVFQEPGSSLNPVISCGNQIAESLIVHLKLSSNEARLRSLALLEEVGLSESERIYASFPHELSGGQKQRVMIAMAIACRPRILIADEPTTALDVSVQKNILDLLNTLKEKYNMSVLFISHDLAVLASIANRILVMQKGVIVEENTTEQLFRKPSHPYTQGLIACRPNLSLRPNRLPTVEDFIKASHTSNSGDAPAPLAYQVVEERKAHHQQLYAQIPLIEVINLNTTFHSNSGVKVQAVKQVSFNIYPGETLGLVGESGSGKTSLGRSILRLIEPDSGEVRFNGKDLLSLSNSELRPLRKHMQMVFQDPFSSLNPRMTIGEAISEPMIIHGLALKEEERKDKAIQLLERVGLKASHYHRLPHEFSGGQRQRAGIARALASEPDFIIFDESVSSLDVSAQALILNLINDLKDHYTFTCLFISHDLSVVRYMSDRVVVMQKGAIEEIAEADQLFASPQSTYTQGLIASIPLGGAEDIDLAIAQKRNRNTA